jgi:hypothetical protein
VGGIIADSMLPNGKGGEKATYFCHEFVTRQPERLEGRGIVE